MRYDSASPRAMLLTLALIAGPACLASGQDGSAVSAMSPAPGRMLSGGQIDTNRIVWVKPAVGRIDAFVAPTDGWRVKGPLGTIAIPASVMRGIWKRPEREGLCITTVYGERFFGDVSPTRMKLVSLRDGSPEVSFRLRERDAMRFTAPSRPVPDGWLVWRLRDGDVFCARFVDAGLRLDSTQRGGRSTSVAVESIVFLGYEGSLSVVLDNDAIKYGTTASPDVDVELLCNGARVRVPWKRVHSAVRNLPAIDDGAGEPDFGGARLESIATHLSAQPAATASTPRDEALQPRDRQEADRMRAELERERAGRLRAEVRVSETEAALAAQKETAQKDADAAKAEVRQMARTLEALRIEYTKVADLRSKAESTRVDELEQKLAQAQQNADKLQALYDGARREAEAQNQAAGGHQSELAAQLKEQTQASERLKEALTSEKMVRSRLAAEVAKRDESLAVRIKAAEASLEAAKGREAALAEERDRVQAQLKAVEEARTAASGLQVKELEGKLVAAQARVQGLEADLQQRHKQADEVSRTAAARETELAGQMEARVLEMEQLRETLVSEKMARSRAEAEVRQRSENLAARVKAAEEAAQAVRDRMAVLEKERDELQAKSRKIESARGRAGDERVGELEKELSVVRERSADVQKALEKEQNLTAELAKAEEGLRRERDAHEKAVREAEERAKAESFRAEELAKELVALRSAEQGAQKQEEGLTPAAAPPAREGGGGLEAQLAQAREQVALLTEELRPWREATQKAVKDAEAVLKAMSLQAESTEAVAAGDSTTEVQEKDVAPATPVVAPVAPLAVPLETPLVTEPEVPAETAPTVAPTETPVAAPAAVPVEPPVEAPAAPPAEVPVVAPAESPVAVPAEAPAAVPVEAPAETPVEAPAVAPAGTEPSTEALAAPAEVPAAPAPEAEETLPEVLEPELQTQPEAVETNAPLAGTSGTATPLEAAVQADMVPVPAGTYIMGRTRGDGGDDELPTREVSLPAFLMDVTEVTRDQFAEFASATAYATEAEVAGQSLNWRSPGFEQAGDEPVVHLAWLDAVKFCNWRSTREGLRPCYTINAKNREAECHRDRNGYRLPTEAEWEYAARGGGRDILYPWGDEAELSNAVARANFAQEGDGPRDGWEKPNPVKALPPNSLGLHGMAGNVWEWCEDMYDEKAYAMKTRGRVVDDPCLLPGRKGRGTERRVIRGGSFQNDIADIRCCSRAYGPSNASAARVGFRCVRRDVM